MLADSVLQDLRYAARVARRNIGTTAIAIFALAVGIGVNTATFTAYKAMVARPLDARDPHSVANIALMRGAATDFTFTYAEYEAYRESLRSFSGVIAENHKLLAVSGVGPSASQRASAAGSMLGRLGLSPATTASAEFAMTFLVSDNYFSVLGVDGMRGRSFDQMSAAEILANPPALISQNYLDKRFGGDSSIIGKSVRLNNVSFTISGITPRDFVATFVSVPDFWIPLQLAPLVHSEPNWLRNPYNECCRLFGRLAPGLSMTAAQAEVNVLANQIRLHDPGAEEISTVRAAVWRGSPFPRPVEAGLRLTVILVMIAVAMVLVVACANVASLQLARAVSRTREITMRVSLGATRGRIVRQLLTESVLMALIAGALALLITYAVLKFAVTVAADAFPAEYGTLIFYVTPDMEVFTYVAVVSFVAAMMFGLGPALESVRADLKVNKGGSMRSAKLQKSLIAIQVAVSTVLLIAGTLFLRSAVRAVQAHPGYFTESMLSLQLQFPEWLRYSEEQKRTLVDQVRSRIQALPEVASLAYGRAPMVSAGAERARAFAGEELPPTAEAQPNVYCSYVGENYFSTLGIPILGGRGFDRQDQTSRSVLVSESTAKRLWPGQTAIGQTLRLSTYTRSRLDESVWRVIGVVRDVRGFQPDGSDSQQVYVLASRDALFHLPLLIRSRMPAGKMFADLNDAVSSIDRNAIAYVSSLEDLLRQTPTFIISSLAAFVASGVGLLGLLLACLGLYGTVTFLVALRTRDVGIRIAIGAGRGAILALMLRESMQPVLFGLVCGMGLAAAVCYPLRTLLFGVGPVDGPSFAGVALLLTATALLAAYPPLLRVMRTDPVAALRHE